jgi:hypothetical protein
MTLETGKEALHRITEEDPGLNLLTKLTSCFRPPLSGSSEQPLP